MNGTRSLVATLVAVSFTLSSFAAPVSAGIVATEQLLAAAGQQQTGTRERVDAFLARSEVKQQMEAWGVDPVVAEARVAALSEAELATLAERIDNLPAGAGALEVLGILFLVLLVLELVGVINVFSRI